MPRRQQKIAEIILLTKNNNETYIVPHPHAADIAGLIHSPTNLVNADESKIDIKGSDTLGAKLVPQLKIAYVKDHPSVKIDILAQGSSHAFSNLDAGTADIGMSSRKVKQQELDKFEAKGKALVEHVAA